MSLQSSSLALLLCGFEGYAAITAPAVGAIDLTRGRRHAHARTVRRVRVIVRRLTPVRVVVFVVTHSLPLLSPLVGRLKSGCFTSRALSAQLANHRGIDDNVSTPTTRFAWLPLVGRLLVESWLVRPASAANVLRMHDG